MDHRMVPAMAVDLDDGLEVRAGALDPCGPAIQVSCGLGPLDVGLVTEDQSELPVIGGWEGVDLPSEGV